MNVTRVVTTTILLSAVAAVAVPAVAVPGLAVPRAGVRIGAVPSGLLSPWVIVPGRGIGPVRLGMSEADLRQTLGRPSAEVPANNQRVFDFTTQGLTIWVEGGRVVRVRTTNAAHTTASGFGPGLSNWDAARSALCEGISARHEVPGGFEIRCPFAGLIIEVQANRVLGMSIIRAESSGRPGGAPPGPPAAPSSPAGLQSLPPLPHAEHVSGSDDPGVVQLVNTARSVSRSCGDNVYRAAPFVTWSERLAYAAQWHALDMAIHDFVEHSGSDGSAPRDRLARAGYRWSSLGEDVAGGFRTADEVATAWLGSPGHCSTIMGKEFTEAGAAWAKGGGRYKTYWVLVMARPQ